MPQSFDSVAQILRLMIGNVAMQVVTGKGCPNMLVGRQFFQIGIKIVKQLPFPRELVTLIFPLCACTMR